MVTVPSAKARFKGLVSNKKGRLNASDDLFYTRMKGYLLE